MSDRKRVGSRAPATTQLDLTSDWRETAAAAAEVGGSRAQRRGGVWYNRPAGRRPVTTAGKRADNGSVMTLETTRTTTTTTTRH